MRWALDPEQQMLQDALGGWLRRVATPSVVRGWLDSADASEFDSAIAEEGWPALGSSEERGGQGGGDRDSRTHGLSNAPSYGSLRSGPGAPHEQTFC